MSLYIECGAGIELNLKNKANELRSIWLLNLGNFLIDLSSDANTNCLFTHP